MSQPPFIHYKYTPVIRYPREDTGRYQRNPRDTQPVQWGANSYSHCSKESQIHRTKILQSDPQELQGFHRGPGIYLKEPPFSVSSSGLLKSSSDIRAFPRAPQRNFKVTSNKKVEFTINQSVIRSTWLPSGRVSGSNLHQKSSKCNEFGVRRNELQHNHYHINKWTINKAMVM